MRNYALITTTLGALVLGVMVCGSALAEDALAGTLPGSAAASAVPAPASAEASATAPAAAPTTPTAGVFVPAAGATTTTTTTSAASTTPPTTTPIATTLPTTTTTTTSSAIVPVTSSASTLSGTALSGANGLTTSPATPQIVQDAMTRLQKVDQINLDDMIRAQDAINRLDLLLEIEKRQTELKKIRDERNKPAISAASAAGLLGSAIPASALNLPKLSVQADTPSSAPTPSFTPKASKSASSGSSSGPNEKYSIKRITGSDGRYFAVINTDDSGAQTVRAGDKLPDGSIVKSVSLTNVSLFKDKKSKTLTIPTDSYIVRDSASSIQ